MRPWKQSTPEELYATRKAIAEKQRQRLGEAIRACGLDVKPRGYYTLVDRTGEKPDLVLYHCRGRDGENVYAFGADGRRFATYEEAFGRPLLYEVWEAKQIHRYELRWAALDLYEPATPEQLRAAKVRRDVRKGEKEKQRELEAFPLFADELRAMHAATASPPASA